jgi:hypothetical protein
MIKNKKYRQGIFNPINPEKYKGSLPIIYRSSLELKSFRWMDNSSKILKWGSESVVIPYQSVDGKIHRYFVDLVCEMKRNDGTIKKYLIEVKPEKQTLPPTIKNKKQKTILYENYQWAVNQLKWKAAKSWCSKKGYEFLILTEKHISI